MTPGSVIVASVGSGPQPPHTDVASHPELLPPNSRDISGCHLSSFLCLSQDYPVAVQEGTALGEAGEARWDTVELQRGDMLLMVATSRHHGLPALPDSKDGLQGALFHLTTPDPRHKHHQPNTTHLDPNPPRRPWRLRGICPAWSSPAWTRCCGWGRGRLGGWGCGRGMLPRPSSPTPPIRSRQAPPPSCPPPFPPFHPTFLSRSAPASDLAVIEVGEQCMLFFVGSVHMLEVCRGDNADAELEIHFAVTGIAPPERPTTLWHLANTAPAWRSPKCAKTGAWSITSPCECKVSLLVCLLCLLANWTKFT